MSEPLIPTSDIPSIENRELAIKTQEDNERYQEECKAATPEKTQQMKEEIWDIFWKDFDPEECLYDNSQELMDWENPDDVLSLLDNSEPNENQDNTSWDEEFYWRLDNYYDELYENIVADHKDKAYFPMIERLNSWENENNLITTKSLKELCLWLEKANFDIFKFDLNSVEDSADKQIISLYLSSFLERWKETNLDTLINDIKDIPELWDFEFDNNTWFKRLFLNSVAKNYVNIPNSEWKIDKQEDLKLAISYTAFDIQKNVKNIRTDTQTYKKAIENIESGDLSKMLIWIESLFVLAYSREWKLAKWQADLYFKNRKRSIIKEAEALEYKIQEAEKNSAENKEKLKELYKMRDLILEEAWELVSWEIFKSTTLDTNDNWENEWQKENS